MPSAYASCCSSFERVATHHSVTIQTDTQLLTFNPVAAAYVSAWLTAMAPRFSCVHNPVNGTWSFMAADAMLRQCHRDNVKAHQDYRDHARLEVANDDHNHLAQ